MISKLPVLLRIAAEATQIECCVFSGLWFLTDIAIEPLPAFFASRFCVSYKSGFTLSLMPTTPAVGCR
jgi:hypothetical protein